MSKYRNVFAAIAFLSVMLCLCAAQDQPAAASNAQTQSAPSNSAASNTASAIVPSTSAGAKGNGLPSPEPS